MSIILVDNTKEEKGRVGVTGRLGLTYIHYRYCAFLVAQLVKNPPAMRETWILSLGWEYPLEKEMAIHSSTIAWKIPRTEEPDRVQSMGLQRVGHD